MAVARCALLVVIMHGMLVHAADRPIALGRSVRVSMHNLQGDLQQSGLTLYKTLPESCFIEVPAFTTTKGFSFYKDTKTLYTTTTTTSGLSASLGRDFSLGFTLDTTSRTISGDSRTVAGSTLSIMGASSKIQVDQDCYYNQELTDEVMKDLDTLPVTISDPWIKNSWTVYDIFLEKHGSHVMTQATMGSSINQMAFANSHKAYSERDFTVKSCVSLGIGKVDTESCTGVTQQEIEKSENFEMSDNLVITGGTAETRNALLAERSNELVSKFMNEANTSASVIQYTYKPLWEILQARFLGVNTDNFLRAINLENYYLGYLNYGCEFEEKNGQHLQKFDYASYSTPQMPAFECTLAPTGCHKYWDDCVYRVGVWCACQGPGCVRHRDTTMNTGDIKPEAYINWDAWGWNGCDWYTWGSSCACINENKVRRVVWSGDDKHSMMSAHYLIMKKIGGRKSRQEL